jgi:hypothetical protein
MTETATVPTTTGDVNICNVLWSHNDDGTIRKRNSDADTSKICPEVKSQDVEYQTHICCPQQAHTWVCMHQKQDYF